MKRNYKGQEGYFYNSGNKKLRQDLATIEFARRLKEGFAPAYLGLYILKDNESSMVFQVDSPRDVLDILCELGVNKPSEVRKLPEEKRRVIMYVEPNMGMNYGFCFASKRKMPVPLERNGSYTSTVGEFHKLGNLEEHGENLPISEPYNGDWPSISTRPSERKLGEIYDGKMYVGKPSAHCLAVTREMRKKPVYSKGYCRGPMHSLYPGFD